MWCMGTHHGSSIAFYSQLAFKKTDLYMLALSVTALNRYSGFTPA